MEVYIQPCEHYELHTCRAALDSFDFSWVRAGMRIGVKANLVSAMEPAAAATTHPVLLTALTELLKEKGASVVIGDSPGGLYNAAHLDRVYTVCGLRQTGAELNHDFSVKDGHFPVGNVLRTFQYTGWLDACDAIINFCKLKTHGMMGMTCAVKNMFGTIPGTMKPEYHFRFPEAMDFASMLVDLQLFWKPAMHIVDAVEAMEGNGPTAGTPKHVGLVLACRDPFALDQVCAGLMGLQPERVLTQKAAMERGLVPEVTATRPWQPTEFQVPPTKSTLFRSLLPGKAGEVLGRTIQKILSPRPTLNPAACVGCQKCANICPAKAITMVNKKPKINRTRCIGCFCCQEFCPKGALEAKRSVAARVLMKC